MGAGSRGARPEPRTFRCAWCGRELAPKRVRVGSRELVVGHEPCGCEGERRAEAEARREVEEAAAAAMRSKILHSGIPPRYLAAELSEPRAARFAASFPAGGDGLYIQGRTGTGKTYLASAVARSVAEAGGRVVMTTAIEMFSAIQETYGGSGSTDAAIRRYTGCDLLVLDDLGKESASQWSAMTLYRIVNDRYGSLRPTVFTSQYALASLEARLSRCGEAETAEAVVSRIRETCAVVALRGPDRRSRA